MRVKTLQINWHEKQPVFSVDFDPSLNVRLATSGGDSNIRIWHKTQDGVEFRSTLSRHTHAVNCVRWSRNSQLCSAGDDGTLLVWELSDKPVATSFEDQEDLETWKITSVLRSTCQVADLCWSPDSKLIASGCIDNQIRIYSVKDQQCIHVITDHNHFVQGVAWDPLGEYLASQSSDRALHIYKYSEKAVKLVTRHTKLEKRIYHDENLCSFFRRLTFSPDGMLLVTPSGICETGNTAYVYTRGNLAVRPEFHLPGHAKPVIGVRFNPVRYALRPGPAVVGLEYRYIYALATQDSVMIYDTQHTKPIAQISSLHYTTLTDISWSRDGGCLVMSSSDGFCSVVEFTDGEFGTPIEITAVTCTEALPISVEAICDPVVCDVPMDLDAIAPLLQIPTQNSEIIEPEPIATVLEQTDENQENYNNGNANCEVAGTTPELKKPEESTKRRIKPTFMGIC